MTAPASRVDRIVSIAAAAAAANDAADRSRSNAASEAARAARARAVAEACPDPGRAAAAAAAAVAARSLEVFMTPEQLAAVEAQRRLPISRSDALVIRRTAEADRRRVLGRYVAIAKAKLAREAARQARVEALARGADRAEVGALATAASHRVLRMSFSEFLGGVSRYQPALGQRAGG